MNLNMWSANSLFYSDVTSFIVIGFYRDFDFTGAVLALLKYFLHIATHLPEEIKDVFNSL